MTAVKDEINELLQIIHFLETPHGKIYDAGMFSQRLKAISEDENLDRETIDLLAGLGSLLAAKKEQFPDMDTSKLRDVFIRKIKNKLLNMTDSQ